MLENTSNHFDDDTQASIERFEQMLDADNALYYFDVYEFEDIIDHYIEIDNVTQAAKVFAIAKKQHPSAISLQIKHAQIKIEQGQHVEALSLLKEIEEIEKYNKDVFVLRGNIYNIMGKHNRARQEFDKALEISFDDKSRTLLEMAITFEQYSRFNIAIEYLEQAYKLDPNDDEVLFELGYCYENSGQNKKSIAAYEEYLNENPFSDNAWYNKGIVHNRMDDFEKAIEAYDFALAINEKHDKAHFNKANALANCDLYLEAIESYTQYLNFDDDHASTHSYIGECYEKLKQYDSAMEHYNKAISINKDLPDPWFGMGLIMMSRECLDESFIFLSKARELDDTNPDYWFAIASLYTQINKPRKAVDAYRKAITLDPYDPAYPITLAEYYHKTGKQEAAIKVLSESMNYCSENAELNYQMAAYQIIREDVDSAKKYFRKAIGLDSDSYEDMFKQFPQLKDNKHFHDIINASDLN